jgi:hypothetical protein
MPKPPAERKPDIVDRRDNMLRYHLRKSKDGKRQWATSSAEPFTDERRKWAPWVLERLKSEPEKPFYDRSSLIFLEDQRKVAPPAEHPKKPGLWRRIFRFGR